MYVESCASSVPTVERSHDTVPPGASVSDAVASAPARLVMATSGPVSAAVTVAGAVPVQVIWPWAFDGVVAVPTRKLVNGTGASMRGRCGLRVGTR